jgi:hypothetical protein
MAWCSSSIWQVTTNVYVVIFVVFVLVVVVAVIILLPVLSRASLLVYKSFK